MSKTIGRSLPIKRCHYSTIYGTMQKKSLLILLILVGAFLRIYGLNWGDGYFFHPDERNIISAVSNISIEEGMLNPLFWAYGAGPIYVIYFFTHIFGFIFHLATVDFSSYMLMGRLLSALASIAIIPFTFMVTKQLFNNHPHSWRFAYLSAVWVTFSPGMIQFAHFVSYEGFLTLEYLAILLSSFAILKTGKRKHYLICGTLIGLSVGTKITSLVLLPLLLIAHYTHLKHNKNTSVKSLVFAPNLWLSLLLAGLTSFIVSPFHILDWGGFMNSLAYESNVANGSLPVFYTQQFIGTIPVWYQLTRIFPYILSISLTLVSFVALFWAWVQIVRRSPTAKDTYPFLLLTISLLTLYLFLHFTMFVKWTRYMIPSIPFLATLGALFLSRLNWRSVQTGIITVTTLWVIGSGLWFMQTYERKDVRVVAAEWVEAHVDSTATIGSEVYDLGILPTNNIYPVSKITLYNIYDSDVLGVPPSPESILTTSDYFMVLSERLYQSRLSNPSLYPQGYQLYQTLFNESGGWTEVARFTNTSIHCAWWSLNCMNNIFPPDETFFVFDHPSVYIFKKSE